MKIEEVKTILQGYRPNGADAQDPTFSEALVLVKNDTQLQEWFTRQQRFDRAMSDEFETVHAPPGLRDRIIASVGKTASSGMSGQRRWHRRGAVWMGIAASVVLAISLTLVVRPKPKLPAADSLLADFVIGDAQHPKTHGGHGEEAAALNRMLNKPTTRLSDPLPVDFTTMRNSGGRTLHLEGRDVLEVCFKRNGVGLHCYIARREDFPTLTAPPSPTVADKNGASIATWADTANLYIVVTKPGREAVQKRL